MSEMDDRSRIDVFLDDETGPIVSYRPPVRFELDTTRLEDGPHVMRIEGYDSGGQRGIHTVRFTVRNGPGIAVSGLRPNDVVEGRIPVLVNAYGGAGETTWEPARAETPAPIPTWAWVMVIVFVAFGAFYGIRQWNPPTSLAATSPSGSTAASVSAPSSADAGGSGTGGSGTGGSDATAAGSGGAAVQAAAPTDPALGASVYGSLCASCHMGEGQGMPGVFPPLAGDPVVVADDPTEHVDIVLHGVSGKPIDGVDYASPMPSFASQLSDEEVAAVVNHERSSWGNDAPLVSPAEVAAGR